MDREEDTLESGFHLFDSKMEEPQRAVFLKDWEAFKNFFAKDKRALLEPMDLGSNTAFHVAVGSNDRQLLTEQLEMLSVEERWRALRKKNANGDTLLHVAASCKDIDIVDVLLRYEEEVQPPLDDEETEDSEVREVPLLELRNVLRETPVFAAAKEVNLKMLQHVWLTCRCISADM